MSNTIPPVNNVELNRYHLVEVLQYLADRVKVHLSHPITLLVHGGACMLLHPGLYKLAEQQALMTPDMPIRRTTRDVDYIHRAFVDECMAYGDPEAPGKLLTCIKETAVAFRLGADWMNSAADVALPMATDPTGRRVDPIYTASTQKSNIEFHTIFSSHNKVLRLISVAPFWAVSLKLVRYNRWDPYDICILLKYGTIVSRGFTWSRDGLEHWLNTFCWSMGYANYPPEKKVEMRTRIEHAIQMVNERFAKTPTLKESSLPGLRTDTERRQPDTVMGTEGLDPSQAEWGGGDRTGWTASFVGDWVKPHEKPLQLPPQHSTHSPVAPRHSNPHVTPPLSPLFSPHSPQPMTLDSAAHRRIPPDVGDRVTEKEREKRRELEEKPSVWKEEEEEMIEPFVPTVHTTETNYHQRGLSEGVLRCTHEHLESQRPELQRREYSQPITAWRSNTSFHGISESPPSAHNSPAYRQTSPISNSPRYHTQTPTLPNAPIHHQPHFIRQTPALLSDPQQLATPHAAPARPTIYQYTSINIYETAPKKKSNTKNKATRKKERSAKQSRHSHSPSPDGIYGVDRRKQPRKSRPDSDDEDDPPAPITPPNQAPSTILLPPTVVYYDYRGQQQQNQHQQHRSPPSFPSSHPSPPQIGQVYGQPPPSMRVQPTPPMYFSHHITVRAQSQTTAPGRFLSPAPMIYTDHHPVIPPQEFIKPKKPSSLPKWMSVFGL